MRDLTEPPGREEAAPTYYERPLLKMPHWNWQISVYLFTGGLMGGLGLIQLLVDPNDESERKLRRTVRMTSFLLAGANPGILITHLGKPERFLNMLRIVKFKSPMSLGVWALVLYSGAAGGNVLHELATSGTIPRWLRHFAPGILTPLQALLGGFTAGYTGVLLSASANPFWGSGKRHIPAASVCSGLSSACALSTLLSVLEGNHRVTRKLERLELVAAGMELAILTHFERHAGDYGKPFFTGSRGKQVRTYTIAAGILAPMALNLLGMLPLPKPIDATRAVLASVLTLVGGYVFRDSLVEAGKQSVRDPRAAFIQPT
jgi:formate-dependent nitrite reductase membrane component NrfD